MPFGPASLLGVERFSDESEAPLELLPGDDDAKKEQIIRRVYQQVLGNAYVMESERQVIAESQFKLGEISVRELVRRIAKSELYRTRFFDTCSRYRYIELAFRHFLGRAPEDFQEMRTTPSASIAMGTRQTSTAFSIHPTTRMLSESGLCPSSEAGKQNAAPLFRNSPGVSNFCEATAAAA